MNLLPRPESNADHAAMRHVNRLAFGQDEESRLVDALRDGGYVRVSLVAERAGQIVGHILFSDLPIITRAGTVPALALAPMAVLPEFQNQGIGSELVRCGLEKCRRQGHKIVVVLGHAHFYPRFGFSPKLAAHLESPFSGSDSFMAVELVPGALDGVARREYPLPFYSFAELQPTVSCSPAPVHQGRLYTTVALLAVKTTNQLHPCGVQTLQNTLEEAGCEAKE